MNVASEPLTVLERAIVTALVSAIVRDLRSESVAAEPTTADMPSTTALAARRSANDERSWT
jgi:hypothetical protein